jgi:uncharacterized protein YchJ
LAITEIGTSYQAQEKDYTIVAIKPGVIVSLPSPILDAQMQLTRGKVYNVVNATFGKSKGSIRVSAQFSDGSTCKKIKTGESLTFQRTETRWYVLAGQGTKQSGKKGHPKHCEK